MKNTKSSKCIISISGMHCATCAITIEKALKKQKGVVSASVNYANEKAVVEYDEGKISKNDLVRTINKTGYKAIDEVENGMKILELKVIGMNSSHCAGIVG